MSRANAQSSVVKMNRITTTLFLGVLLTLGLVSTTWASGIPWQVGDIVVCYGGGNCNVLRIHGTSVQLLDTISDTILGNTGGVALNNSLHVVATDDHGGGQSKVVVYSIASINPFVGTVLTHNVINTPYNASGSAGDSAAAVAVNSAGHIFVGNAIHAGSFASIVELDAHGVPTGNVFKFPTASDPCATTTLVSLDINANGDVIYVTAKDGVIRKVSVPFSPTGCVQFANFGSGVTLYGIKDIPAGALTGTCGSNPPNPASNPCPTGESVLVVASGFTDPDASEPGETGPDADAVNICTNSTNQPLVSCALLLDTSSNPGLTSPLWQAGNPYFNLNATILDPQLHLQKVFTAGTSGTQEPTFSEAGLTVIDNAVQWTEAHPVWPPAGSTPLNTVGQLIIDTHSHVQEVSTPGVTGPSAPQFTSDFPVAGETADGLVWQEQLGPVNPYSTGLIYGTGPLKLFVEDTSLTPFVWKALQAGTSGTGCCDDTHFQNTPDNSVTWQDQGQQFWHASFAFSQNAIIVDSNNHVQQVTMAGTSGVSLPAFSATGGSVSDGLIWTDLGASLGSWQMNTQYSVNQIITDNSSPTPHYQQVVVPGTSGSASPSFSTNGGYTLDQSFLPPPAPPSVASASGGSLSAGTYYVELTFVNQYGETLPSTETSLIVPDGSQLTVTAPASPAADPADQPTGYNVYISTSSGTETKQNPTPVPSGTDFGESSLNSGTAPPATNTAGSSVVWHDLGQTGGVWMATTFYPQNAVILASGDVQQATSGGTSRLDPAPGFSTTGGTVNDNVVAWTDRGPLGASTPASFRWAASTAYPNATTAEIVDNGNHVQLASATVTGPSGTSGTPNSPVFVDGGASPLDGSVVWTDEGQQFWEANTPFSALSIIVDGKNHVQQVTTPGTSGPVQPNFSSSGSTASDGLVWTDQGAPGSWSAGGAPALNAVILDSNTPQHVQQVVAATGPSGSTAPAFSTSGGLTIDGSVVWIDRGTGASWASGTPYALNAVILDSNAPAHVQEVTSAGTSGVGAPSSFSTGSTAGNVATDNAVVWTDQGVLGPNTPANFRWAATTMYPNATTAEIVDNSNHIQKATTSGTSAMNPPSFVDGGTVIDGLIWTFVTGPVMVYPASSTQFAVGNQIIDPNSNLQKAIEAGTSKPLTTAAQWQTTGDTFDNTVIWTDLGQPQWPGASTTFTSSQANPPANLNPLVPISGTFILDTNNNLEVVTRAGTTGPYQPGSINSPNNAWSTISGGVTADGLQWKNQAAPATSVAARYPVTGVNTLQSLALDPLVAKCTGNSCSNLPFPITLPARTTSNFWLGDSGSGSFYKLDFATGTPSQFTCSTGCVGIQSLVVYGGEGANQPGLASLVSNFALNTGDAFTTTAQFLQNTITSTLSNNGSGSPPTTTISLYASLVDKTSCFNDPSVGNLGCRGTVAVDPTKALVWKLDVPLNGSAALPPTETLNTSFAATANFGIDNSTDVFVDEQFDDTTFVGADPGTRTVSVHSLHEVSSTPQLGATGAHCTYSSPQNACYKTNRGTLNFTFTCPGLSQLQFQHMHPTLSLVQKHTGQSPKFIPLSGTNGKAPYRFDSSSNFWTFQWSLNGATAGTYEGTTFDTPGLDDNPAVQSFPVTFFLKSSCP